MKSFFLLFFFTLLLSSTIFAQFKEGYIIKNNNDTVYGQIDFEGSIKNSDHCKFKSLKDKSINTYFPGDIKAFRFIGSKYFTTSEISVDNTPHKVFLEWLIKGKASVVTYSPSNAKPRFFVLLANDSLSELQNTYETKEIKGFHDDTYKKEYIGTLRYYFKDCPAIFPAIERSTLNRNSLISITKAYNEKTGTNKEFIIFEKNVKKRRWEIGPSFSSLSSQLRFNKMIPEKAYLTTSTGYGMSLKISGFTSVSNFTKVSKWSFSSEVMYYNLLYKYDITGLPYNISDDKLCKVQYLRIPLQLNYKFSNNKFTPFVSIGLTIDFRVGYTMYDANLVSYVTTHPMYQLGMKFNQIGINSGLGFEYSISPKITINTKVEIERAVRFFGTYPQDNSYNNNVIMQATLLYRIK
jgi:hypothetical protein